ncbi:ABC transporter substrate-binding protein [Natrinema altunense]|uniref:Extracellular ligand-binding receptor n=1 Tax=Natrinema altunense (strain JCM 12890 / CGMCC 1.3731 / AJ2) TaxID=1227494 RepID=L9ZCH7_NATA2|nr:ABC transporter substrate-binding protein [Natrinema altunense]ELY84094.1 Extracellular ligand-binding receptor [Natrinema altunense JCM 12890]
MNDGNHDRANATGPASNGPRRNLDRRRVLKTTAGGAAGLSLAGCLETAGSVVGDDDADPVTIGVLAPNPESDATGRSIVRGAQLAVDQLKDDDGILGREVEMVVGDTNGSPQEARRQYQRLILEEDADVTVGVSTSEVLVPLLDEIAEQETIHLTAGSATTVASERVKSSYDDYKYHFRVGPINGTNLAEAQLDFLTEKGGDIGWDSIAVLAEDYAWTDGLWDFYRSRLPETDIEVTAWERYPPATDDFSEIYTRVEESNADAAFISTAHTGTAALADWRPEERDFEFGGIHVPMQLPSYYRLTGGDCEYAAGYASATDTANLTDKTSDFVTAYQDANGGKSPVYTGYIAYDAVKVFAKAAKRTDSLESDALVGSLEEIEHIGTTGTIQFHGTDDEHPHDVIYGKDNVHPVYFQWQEIDGEGQQTVIWPDEYAADGAEYMTPDWL